MHNKSKQTKTHSSQNAKNKKQNEKQDYSKHHDDAQNAQQE